MESVIDGVHTDMVLSPWSGKSSIKGEYTGADPRGTQPKHPYVPLFLMNKSCKLSLYHLKSQPNILYVQIVSLIYVLETVEDGMNENRRVRWCRAVYQKMYKRKYSTSVGESPPERRRQKVKACVIVGNLGGIRPWRTPAASNMPGSPPTGLSSVDL